MNMSPSKWKLFALLIVALCATGITAAAVARSDGSESRASEVVPVTPGAATIPSASRGAMSGKIAYSPRGATGIWVIRADGTHRRRISNAGKGEDFDPDFSSDGRKIVFRTSRGKYVPDSQGIGLEGIFVVDIATRRERQIQPPFGGLFPAWSPNGKLIALSSLAQRNFADTIFVLDPVGKHLRDLGVPGECATWSPDSREIAYCSHNGDGNWAIWTIDASGGNARQLTHPTPVSPPGSGGHYPGAWSPDGKKIVYSGGQGPGRELYVMNADGSNPYQLTKWPGADGAVAWLRDGNIVFGHFTGDAPMPRWYLVRPDGTGLRALPWLNGAGDPMSWWQPKS